MIYSLSRACRIQRNVKCKFCDEFERQKSTSGVKISKGVDYIEYYHTLGLKSNADQEQVRKAFIALCKKYHPDSGSPEADSQKFHEVRFHV